MIRFLTKSHLENRGIRGAFDGQRTKDHWRSDKLWSFTGETGKGPSEVDMRKALLHKSLRHVRLSPMGQGASMRNDAESIHVPVPSTQLVRLQSGVDRQGASDLLVR